MIGILEMETVPTSNPPPTDMLLQDYSLLSLLFQTVLAAVIPLQKILSFIQSPKLLLALSLIAHTIAPCSWIAHISTPELLQPINGLLEMARRLPFNLPIISIRSAAFIMCV